MLECVVNVSEGRDGALLEGLAGAAAEALLDVHVDPDHHRSVFTLAGPGLKRALERLARAVVGSVDLRTHQGVHPRFGALDVVPFVPLDSAGSPRPDLSLGEAVSARDLFAEWAARELGLPCFCYGPELPLPEVRRRAFRDLAPERGPNRPHPSAGACAVGARHALVAYNLWLGTTELSKARAIATELRGPHVRALGLAVGAGVQVSCNLIDPFALGPEQVYEAVAASAARMGVAVARAELVGLAPLGVVEAVAPRNRRALDLDEERTVEHRIATRLR